MNKASLFALVSFVAGASALIDCVDSNDNPSASDAGTFDARVDSTTPGIDGALPDSAAPDAGEADGGGGDSSVADSSAPDTTAPDSNAPDASAPDAADAAPILDDAGCPVPTGITANLQDAGIPTTGLVLWLRSDIGVATINNAGTSVCRWDDVSGNGNSVSRNTGTLPTRVDAALGTMPAISFNGTDQNLTRGDVLGIGATSGRTVAVYSKTPDTTHRWEPFFQGQGNTGGTYFGIDANTFNTVGGREGVYVTNNSYDLDIATTTAPRSHVLTLSSFAVGTALPGALSYSVDGTLRSFSVAQANGNNLVQDFSAANFTSVGYGEAGFTAGMIGEVIVYNRAIDDTERQMIEQHFAARF